jgi:arylsulfatase A-like enzyme
MLQHSRTWLIAVVLVLLAAGAWVVLDRLGDDDPGRRGKVAVQLPDDPIDAGRDEPGKVRAYVDNAGPRVAVSVRTPRKPWTRSLAVDLNGFSTTVERGRPVAGECGPAVTAVPSSLLTRLTYERSCLPGDTGRLTAKVSVDGGEPVTASAREKKRPNVLMIMVDDMRTDELQWMPNVQDLIAKRGVTFTNGFSSFPLCCPARASVMTGLYPHNHGVWSHEPPWGFSALRDASTFPVWLQRGGYRTTYMGKYLNGYGSDPVPGKDTGTSAQYCPPGWDLWRGSIDGGMDLRAPDNGGTYRYFDTTLNDNCNGFLPLKGRYQTYAYGDLAQQMNAKSASGDEPFFSYVSFTAPHHGAPREPDDPSLISTPARPKRLKGAFDEFITEAPGADWKDPDRSDKPKWMKRVLGKRLKGQMLAGTRQRAEALYAVDQTVKRIITGLRKTGAYDNTLILFTSDNGYFLGEQGKPEGKILPYEPSLRVPVVMAGPGIPRGEVRTDPFLSIDYAPTFADLADVDPGAVLDGRSLLDVARLGDESAGSSWSRVVLTETKPSSAVQKRLEAVDPVGAHSATMLLGKVTGLRTGRYLYTEWQPEPNDPKPGILTELYDVRKDPNQYDNLAVDPANDELVAELHRILVQARRCRGAACERPLPPGLR